MHVLSTNPQSFQTIIIIHLIQVCPCVFRGSKLLSSLNLHADFSFNLWQPDSVFLS